MLHHREMVSLSVIHLQGQNVKASQLVANTGAPCKWPTVTVLPPIINIGTFIFSSHLESCHFILLHNLLILNIYLLQFDNYCLKK